MTELRLAAHQLADRKMIEIWHDGEMVGGIYAFDNGSGVHVTTKHKLIVDAPRTELIGTVRLTSARFEIKHERTR